MSEFELINPPFFSIMKTKSRILVVALFFISVSIKANISDSTKNLSAQKVFIGVKGSFGLSGISGIPKFNTSANETYDGLSFENNTSFKVQNKRAYAWSANLFLSFKIYKDLHLIAEPGYQASQLTYSGTSRFENYLIAKLEDPRSSSFYKYNLSWSEEANYKFSRFVLPVGIRYYFLKNRGTFFASAGGILAYQSEIEISYSATSNASNLKNIETNNELQPSILQDGGYTLPYISVPEGSAKVKPKDLKMDDFHIGYFVGAGYEIPFGPLKLFGEVRAAALPQFTSPIYGKRETQIHKLRPTQFTIELGCAFSLSSTTGSGSKNSGVNEWYLKHVQPK
jgi:hypothetical protein